MKLMRVVSWSVLDGSMNRYRTLCTFPPGKVNTNQDSYSGESDEAFAGRIFGHGPESNSKCDSFFRKIDRIDKARESFASGSNLNGGNNSGFMDNLDSITTLSDGMDEELKNAATYFEMDMDEVIKEDYEYRPDVNHSAGDTYTIKDLDLTKPGVPKTRKRIEFEVTTEEALRNADFRNVRFLAKFITEGGIIIQRSKTGISAKAQRKVAKEIKTARAFGLMPFTTMGTKRFAFGKTMESLEVDYEYSSYDSHPISFVD